MKLLRYGPAGQEKPGIARPRRPHPRPLGRGQRHRRQRAVAGLARPAAPARPGEPAAGLGLAAHRRLRRRRVEGAGDRPQLSPARAGGRHADPERADLLPQGDEQHLRPERRRHHPQGLGRRPTTRSSWRSSSARTARYVDEQGRQKAHRRLLRRQRRLRARIPDRARRPMDQGQELRHVLPDGPVAGHRRRGRATPASSRCGPRSTASGGRTAIPPT